MAKLTRGALKTSQTNPLSASSPRQTYSKTPKVRVPFQKLSKHMVVLPTRKIKDSSFDELLLWLTRIAA